MFVSNRGSQLQNRLKNATIAYWEGISWQYDAYFVFHTALPIGSMGLEYLPTFTIHLQ